MMLIEFSYMEVIMNFNTENIRHFFYSGRKARLRTQPLNMINAIKLFVIKILMASFFSGAMYLATNPDVFGDKALAMSISSACLVMGVCFLYLLNRKLIRLGI